MRILRRLFLVVAVLLVVLVTIGVGGGAWLLRRPFPQTAGALVAPGLDAEVRVTRDAYGVPTLYAGSERDLFFAQGYVHAQDRFWQMEFWRHVGQGRLAEMLGEDLVESDRFIRTMGWNRMAQESLDWYEANDPEQMAILERYSEGVNAYIEANRDALSLNLTILQQVYEPWEIEPWTPLDTVSWGVVMADDLSGNWGSELDRAALIEAIGEARAAELMPFYDFDARPVIAPSELLTPAGEGSVPASIASQGGLPRGLAVARPPSLFGRGEGIGSNNWVIAGEHTDTGMPLLADDPHLGIQMPAIWYEMGLHAPGFDVVGFSFAGVPGIIVGHNERIAWGVTNVGPDVQDLFIERINPDDPDQYEFEGQWREVERITETINVNGGEPVTVEVRATHHGPIISPLLDESDEVLSMRWTHGVAPSRIFKAVIALNRATDFATFREALRYWDMAAQNFVYADVEGNIGYQMPGLIPIRRAGDGTVPVPGWSGEYEWEEGWVPYEALPTLFNPPQGYIVTANNAVVDEDYPYLLERSWDNGDRAARITELIEGEIGGDGAVSASDIARIQHDSLSLLGLRYQPLFAGMSSDDPAMQAALERLRAWDGQARRDSVGAAIWEMTYLHLNPAVVGDELPESVADQANAGRRLFLHQLADEPGNPWWDDVGTPVTEGRDEILLRALGEAVAWLSAELGDDPDGWTWGRLHTATFVSNPLGQSGIGPIESLVNRGPLPVDGSASAVNATGWSTASPAAATGIPSMRFIADAGDWDRSLGVLPTGQSGHPTHPHYFDQFALWQEGQLRPQPWSVEAVSAAARDTLLLRPR